jgi:hypothetical protein
MTSALTAASIKQQARELGFDLCGVAPAADHPELGFLRMAGPRLRDDDLPASIGRAARRRPPRRAFRRRPSSSPAPVAPIGRSPSADAVGGSRAAGDDITTFSADDLLA